jgi:hypothetical protein
MAKGDEKKANQRREELADEQRQANERLQSSQTPLEQEYIPISQNFQNQYQNVADQQMQHYNDIMGGYREWREKSITPTVAAINARAPKPFTFERVNYERDPETFGRAISGYTDFANTGGYSPQDIQELRARGISPIRASYGNAMMQLDRQRSLQGGYSPNFTAATAQMQRELPQQLADATTNVNAQLADAIRQGKLAGLGGLTGIGGQEGGWRMNAALANQGADLRAQELTESALSAHDQRKLAAQELLGSSFDRERGLYGTTPGATATFGNQAQEAYRQRLALEQLRGQLGSNYVDNQIRLLNPIDTGGKPWWQTAINVAGAAAPYVAMAASSRELKEDIKPVKGKSASKLTKYLKELPLYTWRYKGDSVRHFGPIAEEFKEKLGIGDGKTIHLADVMGLTLAVAKENA